VAQIKY